MDEELDEGLFDSTHTVHIQAGSITSRTAVDKQYTMCDL